MPDTMRAFVLDAAGPPEALTIRDLPIPVPAPGWVVIEVRAFGLNRSEYHTRIGLADGVTFPRVLGIEAVGGGVACPGGEFRTRQQVATMMGGMGRVFDGGYAQYTSVPAGQVIPFRSDLDWSLIGAVPEMLQTAYGSLTVGLDAQPGQSILIRGGTSSVGMATAILAKQRDMTVLSTTRNPGKAAALSAIDVDHVLIDDGDVAQRVRAILPDGVDTALELVGTPTLPDTLRSTRVHGVVCFSGMLSDAWTVPDFYPIGYLPRGVRLTGYAGEATDLPADVLQQYLDAVADGRAVLPVAHVYAFDQIVEAHAAMEQGRTVGKLVVVVESGLDRSLIVADDGDAKDISEGAPCGSSNSVQRCPNVPIDLGPGSARPCLDYQEADPVLRPFTIDIPQSDLDDLHRRLDMTRWPDQMDGAGWDYGTDPDYLRELIA